MRLEEAGILGWVERDSCKRRKSIPFGHPVAAGGPLLSKLGRGIDLVVNEKADAPNDHGPHNALCIQM